jgi:hypothetical protein
MKFIFFLFIEVDMIPTLQDNKLKLVNNDYSNEDQVVVAYTKISIQRQS